MANPYEIAIRIGVQNNASAALGILAAELLSMDHRVEGLIARFAALGTAQRLALTGGLGLAVGGETLNILGKTVEKGNELVAVQRKMAQAGVAERDIAIATAKAYELSAKYKNLTAVDAFKSINSLRGTFGDAPHAIEFSDISARMDSFLKAYEGGKHSEKESSAESLAALKSGELAGKITPDLMREHVAALVGMKVAFGDTLKITEYLTAQKNAGVGLRNTDDEFRYGMFAALVQEKGQRAGTQLMTAFQKIGAGTGWKQRSLDNAEALGMMDTSKDGIRFKGSDIFARDPAKYATTILKPLVDSMIDAEIKKGETKPENRGIREGQIISSVFSDRNAAVFFTDLIQQNAKFIKDAKLVNDARQEYNKDGGQQGSLDYQTQGFGAQISNLATTLGGPMVKTAVDNLSKLNAVLSGMTESLSGVDPKIVNGLGTALGILAGGIVALGATALVAAAFTAAGTMGIVLIAVTGFVAAVVLFKSGLDALADRIFSALGKVASALSEAILAIPGQVSGAISTAFSKIGSMITNALSSVGGIFSGSNPSGVGGGRGSGAGQFKPQARAMGGPVDSMTPYMVGENGPELFVPYNRGSIVPNHSLGGGGEGVSVNNVITLDGEILHKSVQRHMVRSFTHPTSSPHFDGSRHWSPPDQQFSTG